MDVLTAARKLKPLMPKQVERWLRVRESADPDLQNLIDRQILSTARKLFGDVDSRILLSLPPPQRARGSIKLGTVIYEQEKWPSGISTSELLQNLAIFGRSGAGKTNVAFHLLEQLADKKIPFLFLDFKRTARHLLPRLKAKVNVHTPGRPLSPMAFNPFIPPPGLEPKVHINHVIDAMADAYTLGDGARSILQRALAACHIVGKSAPTIKDILNEVEKLPGTDRARGWKVSTVRALESMAFSDLSGETPVSQDALAQSLLRENTIIELDALSQADKKFLAPMICLWLYHLQLSDPVREKLRLVIFVEEAHHLLHRNDGRATETLMEMLLRQCREVGIAVVVIDQMPHTVSNAVLANVYTTILMNITNPSDMNKAAAISRVDEENKGCFSSLPVGQAIIKLQDRWTDAFLVQFPLVKIKKGAVTDNVLGRLIRRNSTGTRRKALVGQVFGGVSRGSLWDEVLSGVALQFLEDVVLHEDDGVKKRYERLGLNAGAGTRLKEELMEAGWLDSETVAVGRSRMLLLRLTTDAKKTLGQEATNSVRASIAHEYWKRFYARKFMIEGYKVQLEAPIAGGRVDVLATRNGERVVIEVETGKSDVVGNVKRCLRAGFDRVAVVATDDAAIRKVERLLADAGLLIKNRVQLVLSDKLD